MRLKIKNNKNVLLSNGTFLDYGNETINEIIKTNFVESIKDENLYILINIATEVIAIMYEKIYESCTDDDIDLIE